MASSESRVRRVIVYGLVLLGWALLMWGLDRRSLWNDELFTLNMSSGGVLDVMDASARDLHPPLYFLSVRAWLALAGPSDFSLRFLSAAYGLVGLALMPIAARRLVGSRAAMAATLMLAVSPAFIEFSRMARYYSLLLMLGLLSTKVLLDAVDRNDWRHWAANALANLALLYTFYPSGVFLIAQALLIILPLRRRDLLRRWLTATVITGVAFAPWLIVVATQQMSSVATGPGNDLARSGLGFALSIGASVYTFSVGESLYPWQPEAWLGLALIVALLLAGLRKSPEHGRREQVGLFLVSIVFVALSINYVSVGTPFLNVPVRGLFTLPFFVMVAASGLTSLASARGRAGLMGALLAVWSISLFNYYTDRQFINPIYFTPAKEAADYVRDHAQPVDLVLSDFDSVFGHYFVRDEPRPAHLYTDRVDEIQAALQTTKPPQVWLVTLGRDQTQRDSTASRIRALLSSDYRLARVQPYLPVDPIYLTLKERVLRHESYTYRLTVEQYTRTAP